MVALRASLLILRGGADARCRRPSGERPPEQEKLSPGHRQRHEGRSAAADQTVTVPSDSGSGVKSEGERRSAFPTRDRRSIRKRRQVVGSPRASCRSGSLSDALSSDLGRSDEVARVVYAAASRTVGRAPSPPRAPRLPGNRALCLGCALHNVVISPPHNLSVDVLL